VNGGAGARARAKAALSRNFTGTTDHRGYVDWPQANLVSGVRLDQFERDLRQGDGSELRMKFCAVHSSAALAVNCFAPFKDRLEDLFLLGKHGAVGIQFEKQMPIVPGRRPSNLDVWIDRKSSAVAIESKLLEYFEPKKPEFAEAYKTMEPVSEPCWWSVCKNSWNGNAQHLDIAQLVKHYFGLRRFQMAANHQPDLVLLYLFWEPTNWQDIAECKQHRNEVEKLAEQVAASAISFRWMTYPSLWQEWMANPQLAEHASNLKARYEICA
jgi:hypothetical protein